MSLNVRINISLGGKMFNVAIDGNVGSGKSTLAKELSERLNFKVLDTGAIYRGIACYYKSLYKTEPNEKIIEDFVKNIEIEIKFIDDKQHVIVNDIDYTPYLRLEETSMMASTISQFKLIRESVLFLQRQFAEENNCIIEGRDIGTVVLPNAQIKLFVTASEQVRAMRRYEQMKDKPNSPSYNEVLEDLRLRDYKDMHREIAPLKPAKDSIIIDSSNQTLEETVECCIKIIKKKYVENSN